MSVPNETCEECKSTGRVLVAPATVEAGEVVDEVWGDCPVCSKKPEPDPDEDYQTAVDNSLTN